MSECKNCSMFEIKLDYCVCANTGDLVRGKDSCENWEPNDELLLKMLKDENADLRRKLYTTKWQPIQSAPKDGTRVIICAKGIPNSQAESAFVNGKWWCADDYERKLFSYYIEPTHWMPLPSPPEANNETV